MMSDLALSLANATDGRNGRRLRNRDAVLVAAIEMFADGDVAPAMEDVAVHAGVSVRSVYRYFETRDALIRAALERLIDQAALHLGVLPAADGDLAARIDHFTQQRVVLYFEFAPLARVAIALGRTDPMVQDLFDYGRDSLRQQFVDQFDADLQQLDARERTLVTVAATLPLQFHAFEHLHKVCNLDADQMHHLLAEQLHLHLSAI